MHRMAQLVGQREHAVQGALVVQQDVGRRVVAPAGIGAGTLAPALRHVEPALLEGLSRDRLVLAAQRGDRREDPLLRLFPAHLELEVGHQRHIHVVHVEAIEAEGPAPQRHVAVEDVEALVDRVDQAVVNRTRNIVRKEARLERRRVLARAGAEDGGLDRAVERRGQRVPEPAVRVVERLEGGAPHRPVMVLQEHDEVPLAELRLASLAVRHHGEPEVRVAEPGERLVRAAQRLAGEGEQPLLGVGQRVRLEAQQHLEGKAVEGELGRGEEPLDRIVRDGHDLGSDPGELGGCLVVQRRGPVKDRLVPLVAEVFVVPEVRVGVKLLEDALDLVLRLERGAKDGRGACEPPLEREQRLELRAEALEVGLPGRVVAVERGQVPGHVPRQLGPRGDLLSRHGRKLSDGLEPRQVVLREGVRRGKMRCDG